MIIIKKELNMLVFLEKDQLYLQYMKNEIYIIQIIFIIIVITSDKFLMNIF